MDRPPLAVIALFSPLLLASAPIPPANGHMQQPDAIHLGFAIYAATLNVVRLQSDVQISQDRYRVDLAYQTAGLFGAIIHSQITSFAVGSWDGTQPVPQRFASWGDLRGEERRTVIDFVQGQPKVLELQPASEADRDPVPVAEQRNTIDTLSAMAMLVRQVASNGRCDGHAMTFDGRRLSEITAHTVGTETLAAESRSSFSGPALRCEMTGQQLAGFQHDTDEATLHKQHHSTVWLARVTSAGPMVPVQVVFETPFFGHATAYLVEAKATPPLN